RPTPSAVELDWPPRRDGGHVVLSAGPETAEASTTVGESKSHGKHQWPGHRWSHLTPRLDGSIWVERAGDVWHVWFPKDGRVRVAVHTTYYLNDASLDGVAHDVRDWDVATTS